MTTIQLNIKVIIFMTIKLAAVTTSQMKWNWLQLALHIEIVCDTIKKLGALFSKVNLCNNDRLGNSELMRSRI